MAKGGVRPNSGRKKGVPSIKKDLKELFEKHGLVDKAIAVLKESLDKKKDPKTAEYVLDQYWGRATQKQEITGKEGGAIKIEFPAKRPLDPMDK